MKTSCRFSCDEKSRFIFLHKLIEDMIVKAIESKTPGKGLKKDGKSSFFLYVNNTIPHSEHVLSEIYEKHKAQDGFLYITYGEMEKF